MNRNMLWKKPLIVALGVAGGSTLLGVSGYLLWNSKKMRMLRTLHRVERILSKTGEALQSVSEII